MAKEKFIARNVYTEEDSNDNKPQYMICQRCCVPISNGTRFCGETCKVLFSQGK